MARSMRLGVRSLVAFVGFMAFACPASADEMWVAPTLQPDLGGLGIASNVVWPATAIGASRFAWGVPDNLETFQGAKVVLIPHAPGGAATLNVIVCAAENGQPVLGTCAGPFAHAFTGVANRLAEVDISADLAPRVGAAGLNNLAVFAYTSPTALTDHLVGLRFSFTPAVPTGVATLQANTFTGTQTAPAFVGDGSGLTNLPAPSNVATLGANVFSGTQTAPSFAGDGSGVSNVNANLLDGLDSTAFAAAAHGHNVSQITNAARLAGGNTFTSTQTIDSGNLDLDASTAAAGNITKNGVLFLHNFGGAFNTFLGETAGNLTMTGGNNTGIGRTALASNTTGFSNTATGLSAMFSNTTGTQNVAYGWSALSSNVGGSTNTALGFRALTTTTGSNNVAAGGDALFHNTSGGNNVAVGTSAGFNATTGSNNIYLGANVLGAAGEANTMRLGLPGTQTRTFIAGVRGITTGVPDAIPVVIDSAGQLGTAPAALATLGANTFLGTQTAPAFAGDGSAVSNVNADLLDGLNSTAFASAGHGHDVSQVKNAAQRSGGNLLMGTQTLDAGNLDLDDSTALTGLVTKNSARFLHNFGDSNTFLGVEAGNLTMTGARNVGMGSQSLGRNISGYENTAVGRSSLFDNTIGFNNTAVGQNAMEANLSGAFNSGFGSHALQSNQIGDYNTAVGAGALSGSLDGFRNTAVGTYAFWSSAGESNVALGYGAGFNATTGSNNIYLGANVGGLVGESDTMYLGLVGTQTKTLIAGVRDIQTGEQDAIPVVIDSLGQLGTVNSSRRYKEDIRDMADSSRRLYQLRPVTFRYSQAYHNGSKPTQFGLIAEEVAEVFPELAVRNAHGEIQTVHYETLNVLLLNELQAQQKEIERTKQKMEELERQLDALLQAGTRN